MENSTSVERSFEREILDGDNIVEHLASRSYRELTAIHRLLGNTRFLVRALRQDPLPIRRVLDVGCGQGGVLQDVTQALGVEGIGVDLVPRAGNLAIVQADAINDPLPQVDVAYSTYVAHHLSDADLVQMIRNVGRFCRRFVLLDVVRNPVPLVLFRMFVAPFVSRITAADGQTSIRRAYAPRELRTLVASALAGTQATYRHSVAPFGLRQVIDISYGSEQQ